MNQQTEHNSKSLIVGCSVGKRLEESCPCEKAGTGRRSLLPGPWWVWPLLSVTLAGVASLVAYLLTPADPAADQALEELTRWFGGAH
jgi:hypothetical protein